MSGEIVQAVTYATHAGAPDGWMFFKGAMVTALWDYDGDLHDARLMRAAERLTQKARDARGTLRVLQVPDLDDDEDAA